MATQCTRYECPHKINGSCKHNVHINGLKCKGNEVGYQYRSQIQAIHADYEKACECKGVEPMPRNMYLEF